MSHLRLRGSMGERVAHMRSTSAADVWMAEVDDPRRMNRDAGIRLAGNRRG